MNSAWQWAKLQHFGVWFRVLVLTVYHRLNRIRQKCFHATEVSTTCSWNGWTSYSEISWFQTNHSQNHAIRLQNPRQLGENKCSIYHRRLISLLQGCRLQLLLSDKWPSTVSRSEFLTRLSVQRLFKLLKLTTVFSRILVHWIHILRSHLPCNRGNNTLRFRVTSVKLFLMSENATLVPCQEVFD